MKTYTIRYSDGSYSRLHTVAAETILAAIESFLRLAERKGLRVDEVESVTLNGGK